jgi:hypothetical protein
MPTLLLTFDCLPRRWFGCYGGMEIGTRGFDTLAANGCVFDGCFVDFVQRSSSFGLTVSENGEWLDSGEGVEQPIWTNDFQAASRGETKLGRDLSAAMKWMAALKAGGIAWVRHPGIRSETWPWQGDDAAEALAEELEDIDHLVLKFLARWQEAATAEWTLIVAGGCGLARRQPRIAQTGTGDRDLDALCDDLIHVPVWLVHGKGAPFGSRVAGLCSTSSVGATILAATSGGDSPRISPTLFDLMASREGAAELVIRDGDAVAGLRTPDWFYRRKVDSAGAIVTQSLFRKPDDVCDVFDVSRLHQDIAEQLTARLQGEANPMA